MPAERPRSSSSPFAFLTALSGQSEMDRQIVAATRGTEVKIVSHMVLASKVSTLYAFSGNGKSSLISAGLIPAFLDLGFAVFKTRPRPPYGLANPIDAFKEGCIRDSWLPASADDRSVLIEEARKQLQDIPPDALPGVRRLLDRFAIDGTAGPTKALDRGAGLSLHLRKHIDRPLPEFLAAARDFLGVAVPMVIICDQFEELFVHYYNRPVLRTFAEALRDLCDTSTLRVHILFSMREDWVGSMITLRDVIPDILNSAYRLDPMRVSAADSALTVPVEAAGATINPEVTHELLADLADFYRRQQRVVTHMTASVQDDPFIELPALQIVGERLWQAMPSDSRTITKSQYSALSPPANVARAGSAAAAVLEHYLFDILDTIDAAEAAAISHRDARIDALYLLTDKFAHRRALSRQELFTELKSIRAGVVTATGGSADVSLEELARALKPLLERRLVLASEGGSEGPRYELAHDFMVRSIVRAWSALDLRRAEERGLSEERRRHAAERLQTLTTYVKSGDRLLKVLLGLTALAFLVFGIDLADAYRYGDISFYLTRSLGGVLVIGASTAVIAAALVLRNWTGVLWGCFVLLARFTTPDFGYRWPYPNLLLNQWLVALMCLVPIVVWNRPNAETSNVKATRRARVIAVALDYGLFATIAAITLALEGDSDPVAGFLLALIALLALQIVAIVVKKETIGRLLATWLRTRQTISDNGRSFSVSDNPDISSDLETPPAGRTLGSFLKRFAKIGAILLTYLLGWLVVGLGTDAPPFFLYPYGNPIYVGAHAVLLATLMAYAAGWGMFAPRQVEAVELGIRDRVEPQYPSAAGVGESATALDTHGSDSITP